MAKLGTSAVASTPSSLLNSLSLPAQSGWRVSFPNDLPSFHFYPFTRAQFDAVFKVYDDSIAKLPQVPSCENLFGWNVHHFPLTRRDDKSIVGRARFTTRVKASLDYVDAIITSADLNVWPLLVTPPNWRHEQRSSVSTQVP
ncbi:unnamed protein product [Phytophthora lilii]|uniref:Unnamed protein product n=1 Tax=Phytophthora lilii TaxID=2077276 RepID=A0A9W6YEF6_9STRA|nr:unnamed protein product [Phytophthora lilii]